jgi:hypothetical protein
MSDLGCGRTPAKKRKSAPDFGVARRRLARLGHSGSLVELTDHGEPLLSTPLLTGPEHFRDEEERKPDCSGITGVEGKECGEDEAGYDRSSGAGPAESDRGPITVVGQATVGMIARKTAPPGSRPSLRT